MPIGAGTALIYPQQTATPGTTNPTNTRAPSVNTPLIFEPTATLLAAEQLPQAPYIGIAMSAGPGGIFDANWGGANVYVSVDNITYRYLGVLYGPTRQGVLTADLAAYGGANPDNTNTLSVATVESNGELETATAGDAAAFRTLCAACDIDYSNIEYFAYQTATLTGANLYDLTTLYRGLYDTTASMHASGSLFARLDGDTFAMPLPADYVGVLLYIKLQSFNQHNQGLQDLSACTAYTFTPSGIGAFGYVQEVDTAEGISGGPITAKGTVRLSHIATGDFLANISGSSAAPTPTAASAFLDSVFSSVPGMMLRRGSSLWAAEAPPLPYAGFMPGVPSSNAIIRFMVTEATAFATNFAGSYGLAKTASTTTAITTVNVIHAGVTTQIGSITFPSSATATFGTTGSTTQSAAAGDCLEFVYPASPDATLADVAHTLRGTRS